MPEITVIMPTLNVKEYVAECIESVLNQTFGNFEVLIIDAGSDDGTEKIIAGYEEIDPRVRVVLSGRRSYGYQVNKGISMARGRYVAIVETDDYIDREMLSELYKKAEEYSLDFVKADNYNFVRMNSGDIWKFRFYSAAPQIYNTVIDPASHRELHMSDIFIWKGLYNTEFLKKYDIKLNESDGAAFQDAGFLFQTIGHAKRIMYLDKVFYYYRQDNAASSIFNRKGFSYLVNEYQYIYEKLSTKSIWKEIEPYYYCRLFMQINGRIRTMAASGELWKEAVEDVRTLQQILASASGAHVFDEYILDETNWTELQMFLLDYETYIQTKMSLYSMKREWLRKLYEKVSCYETIVFYSCSNVGKFVECLLERAGIAQNIVFCDNNSRKHGTLYAGKKVYSVEESADRFKSAVYIIANRRYSKDMREQLLALGVDCQDIVQYRLGCDLLNLHLGGLESAL